MHARSLVPGGWLPSKTTYQLRSICSLSQSPGSSLLYNARNAKRMCASNARGELVSEQKPNKDMFVHPGRGLVTYE